MNNRSNSIERNLKLIATAGAGLLLALTGTLIVVQQRLGDSQSRLTEIIVPTQKKLGELTADVGRLFLRQSEIVASGAKDLQALADRDREESAIRQSQSELTTLLNQPELVDHPQFPEATLQYIEGDVGAFLQADTELFETVVGHRQLQEQFEAAVIALESDLRDLMVSSAGAAGVLRLQYVASLRKIHKQLQRHEVNEQDVQRAVVGDIRIQLSAISELDSAVLRLGVLAGKVGLASNSDAMNSLQANELNQNKQQIQDALHRLENLTDGSAIADRVSSIRAKALELADRVGSAVRPDSLAHLRREMLAQDERVRSIQATAATTASNLNTQIVVLRDFTEALGRDADASAASTIWSSRWATAIVSLIGLILSATAGHRLRQSIVALRLQNTHLENLSAKLAEANSTLEATVAERTASLQLILDNTGEGVLSVSLDGSLLPERSRTVSQWCGQARPNAKLWDYLGSEDQRFADSLETAFDQIADQFLPFEVAAGQAPKQLNRHGKVLSLGFREVLEQGKLAKVLVIISDITQQIEAQRVEQESRELHNLVGNLLRDRDGFHQQLDECAGLIDRVTPDADPVVVKRLIHTIKGNCAIIGFQRIATWAHALEDRLAIDCRNPLQSECADLRQLWKRSLEQIASYLTIDSRSSVHIQKQELDDLKQLVAETSIAEQINELIEYWNCEPISDHLNRLADQSLQLAGRLRKEIRVVVEDNGVRIPRNSLKKFWGSLIHLIRNALDHGLESTAQRALAGKSSPGTLRFGAVADSDALEISISDDGSGIDWERVRDRAEELGIACTTSEELTESLFVDGLSTKSTVTELSGRGVGLSAVRESCRENGGVVEIESETNRGTLFRFIFSRQQLHFAQPLVPHSAASVRTSVVS